MKFDDTFQRIMEANITASPAPAPVRTPTKPAPTPTKPAPGPKRPSWFPKPGIKPNPKAVKPVEDEESMLDAGSSFSDHDIKLFKSRSERTKNLLK